MQCFLPQADAHGLARRYLGLPVGKDLKTAGASQFATQQTGRSHLLDLSDLQLQGAMV